MAIKVGGRPGGSTLDLKNAGTALFEPDLNHLSLDAILVLASGKFSGAPDQPGDHSAVHTRLLQLAPKSVSRIR
jgi:hypothetical protein